MATNDEGRPGRAKPNESENQPDDRAEEERRSQSEGENRGDAEERSKRDPGFDEQRKDETSGPPVGKP
jgi:hypothetical protein